MLISFISTDAVKSEVEIEILPRIYYPHTHDDIINLYMDNSEDTVAAMEVTIHYDRDCFTVTNVEKAIRSDPIESLQYMLIPEGIRIIMVGKNNAIEPGKGRIILFTVDIADYPQKNNWEITECIARDPYAQQISCIANETYIEVTYCDSWQYISSSEFDIDDVLIGMAGTSEQALILDNSYIMDWNVNMEVEGCVIVDQLTLVVKGYTSRKVDFYCCPQKEGLCEGIITISNFCGPYYAFVQCNGVVPSGTKGDVNNDSKINILDVIKAINLKINNLDFRPEAWAADCNGDGKIDIIDILGIVNVILNIGTCPP